MTASRTRRKPRTKLRVLKRWGYAKQTFTVPQLHIYQRPQTTDAKVVDEVLVGHAYQNKTAGLVIESDDVWLDLGGNIGTFALFALATGAKVVSVEPEPENASLLRKNLAANGTTFGNGLSKHPTVKQPATLDDQARYDVVEAGVGVTAGKSTLHLCSGEYNKYRHTMYTTKRWDARSRTWKTSARPRPTVQVRIVALTDLLRRYPTINAIKMDIEGAEIPLLESLDAATCKPLRKLVFEYTFDVDPSIPRFMAIVRRLKQWFPTVHYTKVNPKDEEYRHYPPCTMVYCVRPEKGAK